jgi:adenylate cyclase
VILVGEARIDFEAEGLLEGCDESTRPDRIALLEQLFQDGVSLDEVRCAIAEDRLFMLPVERALGGPAVYTPREVAERTEVPVEFVVELRRALGMPVHDLDARSLSDHDVEAVRLFGRFLSVGIGSDGVLEVARLFARGMSAGADALRGVIGRPLVRAGLGERELAMRNAQIADQLLPIAGPVLAYILRLQLLDLIRDEVVGFAELSTEGRVPGSRDVAVCFADFVGFTPLTERGAPEAPGDVARRLEELVAETVEPPVRLIKTIGDAAMLVAGELDAAVEASLRLLAAARRQERLPGLRAGLAWGTAINRSGDWYGATVNRASRLTDIAETDTVMCDVAVKDRLDARYVARSLGRRTLKGIQAPLEVFEVRRAEA